MLSTLGILFVAMNGAFASTTWPCEQPVVSLDDGYTYTAAFIAANVQIQRACEAALQNGKPPMDENVGDTLYHLKQAKQYLGCAKEIITPYLKSPSELIKGSAAVTAKALDTLADGADKEIALYKHALESAEASSKGKSPLVSTAEFADGMADIGVQEDSGWEFLTKATQAAFYTVVDMNRVNAAGETGNPDQQDWRRLSITLKQRKNLLALLEQSFGPTVKLGLNAQAQNQTSVQTGAEFLYQAISHPQWKARDE